MTLAQFLQAFKRLAKPGQWKVARKGRIRHRRSGDCPITFTGRRLTGERFTIDRYGDCAASMGIRRDAAHRAAQAADRNDSPSWRTRYVRNRFLDYAGLR